MLSIYPRNVPVAVACHGATVRNAGPGIVYYADNPDVSAQNFEGSIAADSFAVLLGTQWFLAPTAPANLTLASLPPVGPPVVVPYSLPGTLEVAAGALPFIVPADGTLVGAIANARVAPTGQDAVFDLNRNGTTVFTTQGNRPTIPKDGYVGTVALPDITQLEVGDTLTVDVDAVGFTPDPVPVAFVGTDIGAFGSGLAYSVPRPAGIQAGDHMIFVMRARGGGDWSAPAGAGWIKHTAGVGISDTGSFVFSRRDDGTDGPWIFRGTLTASSVLSSRIWYRNVYSVSPIDVIATVKGASGTAHTLPSANTSVIDTKVLAIASVDQNKTATLPSGHTARAGFDGTTVLQCHFADKVLASAGAMGSESFTIPNTASSANVHLALRRVPDPAVPSPGEDATVVVRYIERQQQ